MKDNNYVKTGEENLGRIDCRIEKYFL